MKNKNIGQNTSADSCLAPSAKKNKLFFGFSNLRTSLILYFKSIRISSEKNSGTVETNKIHDVIINKMSKEKFTMINPPNKGPNIEKKVEKACKVPICFPSFWSLVNLTKST